MQTNPDRNLKVPRMRRSLKARPADRRPRSRDHGRDLIGHLIPLLPFVWLGRTPALVLAIVFSALVLFGVGVYSALTLTGDWRRSGLRSRRCSAAGAAEE